MTHTSQGISPLRQRMIDDMRMRKLAPKTQAGYVRVVPQFAVFLGRPPDTATLEDQLHLVDHGICRVDREVRGQQALCEKAEMRWTQRGAHLQLQTHVQFLNDDPRKTFARWFPGMRAEEPAALKEAA